MSTDRPPQIQSLHTPAQQLFLVALALYPMCISLALELTLLACCLPALLKLLQERERQRTTEPDADLDAFLRARVQEGMHGSVSTELVLRLLGLEARLTACHTPCSMQEASQSEPACKPCMLPCTGTC